MSKSFKSQINLQGFILEREEKLKSEQTIKGLLRSVLIPVFEDLSVKASVFIRLKNTNDIEGLIQRLEYAKNIKTYSYTQELSFKNVEKKDIWGEAEFVFVISNRYTSCLIWDYSLYKGKTSPIYFKMNSRNIIEVLNVILENTSVDLTKELADYGFERRVHPALNSAINLLSDNIENLNNENILLKTEKDSSINQNETNSIKQILSEKTRFISHEIKNHLSIINLYTKILEKRTTEKNQNKQSIKNAISNIKKSSESITEFLNELKNFSSSNLDEKDVNELILSVIDLIKEKATQKNIEIKYENKGLLYGFLNKFKTENVLINLIYNAIDAIENKGKIEINAEINENNFIQIRIKDSGKGIEKSRQEKIFEEGYTTKQTGQGLGLYICKNNMNEQFGELNLIHSDKTGTEFEVLIPAI